MMQGSLLGGGATAGAGEVLSSRQYMEQPMHNHSLLLKHMAMQLVA
jgi:hypothetical protein